MDEEIISSVHEIWAAGRSEGTAVGMFTPDLKELSEWQEAGASLFLLGSDQSMMLDGAKTLAQAIR